MPKCCVFGCTSPAEEEFDSDWSCGWAAVVQMQSQFHKMARYSIFDLTLDRPRKDYTAAQVVFEAMAS